MAFERIKQWLSGLTGPSTGTGTGTGTVTSTGTGTGASSGGGMSEIKRVKQLWGRQFSVVPEGLAEDQVAAYVDELMSKYKALAVQQEHILSLEKVLQQAAIEADRVAAGITSKAKEEAEAETARLINEAKERAQELMIEARRRAEALTDEDVRNILYAANRRAEITETEAKQRAQLYLLRSREIIESELREDVKVVYHRLLSTLQSLLNEGETIGIEWKGKTAALWKGRAFELAANEMLPHLVTSPEEAKFLSEAPVSAEGPQAVDIIEEEATAPEEATGQSVLLEEEAAAPEEGTEQSVLLEKEAAASEEETEQSVLLRQEAVVPEGAVAVLPTPEADVTEEPQQVSDEKRTEEKAWLSPEVLRESIVEGELELVLIPPVDLAMMSELSQRLQSIPEVKILRTVGSWDQGTTITVALDKPLSLLNILGDTCAVEASQGAPKRGKLRQRVFGGEKGNSEVTRIRIGSRNQPE